MTVLLEVKFLLRQLNRKLAVADAEGRALHEFRHRVFAVGYDQLRERREQAGLRQTVAIDAIVPRLRPGLVEIAERGLFLLVIGQRVAGGGEGCWMAHETRAVCARSRAERDECARCSMQRAAT